MKGWNKRATCRFHLASYQDSIHDCHITVGLNGYHFGAMVGQVQQSSHPCPSRVYHLFGKDMGMEGEVLVMTKGKKGVSAICGHQSALEMLEGLSELKGWSNYSGDWSAQVQRESPTKIWLNLP